MNSMSEQAGRMNHASDFDPSKEIEEYPDLKASLTRYLDNLEMKRYSGKELKSKRNEKRNPSGQNKEIM
ncbi:hypothetical protein FZC79_13500 [Rossellomorea vietnamensis]|uniref:Uncharacterized protein n=1 Tax=Rossellomorea vietnamensis TaxID=218284 RepID=A0A5D4KC87_9BACI|nr:hypothetical protein [Rossellomorea vietnamensis]TYR74489.1 hypothetical protein FZC79_13500 [Rossellomorea vietnamensis]